MNKLRVFLIFTVALLLVAASGTAWASDNIVSTVTIPAGQPVPIIVHNGVPSGTIQLDYTWTTSTCTTGQFAQFNLDMVAEDGSGQSGDYPATLTLAPSGAGTPAQLAPVPSSFTVSGLGWTGSSLVTINIASCDNFADGANLHGNLNANAPGSHLNTISTIQVNIHVVVPTPTFCLMLYSFESDQDTGSLLTSVTVRASRGAVRSTNPGQVSVDGLVANTCESPESFDMAVGLDPQWSTQPQGNPGNATFTYTTAGEFDPSTFNLAAFGAGTPQGQTLCLSNVTLPAGDSFLTRVHSAIISGTPVSSLPSDSDFNFRATLYPAGSNCSGTPLGLAGPTNPATSALTFTVQ